MLNSLIHPQTGRRCRSASWDPTGGNADFRTIDPGATLDLLDVSGAGTVKHIWLTVNTENRNYLRDLVVEMRWDGSEHPAVATPLGDFFALGHARATSVTSLPITVVAGGRSGALNMAAFNCWWQMPFATGARISVRNEGEAPVSHFYYYVDYDELPGGSPTPLRFHAHYRQERPTEATIDLSRDDADWSDVMKLRNPSAEGNYVILDTEGSGHYVGCLLNIDHINPIRSQGWFGEGDDMIFIDGRPGPGAPARPESAPGANDAWPPTLHGTGTEDYFGAAWCYPASQHNTPFHGVSIAGETEGKILEYGGKWSMYRFHVTDPVGFESSVRVTIEHGHANCHADDFSSVAFWYQTPRTTPLPPLPPAAERKPLTDKESLAGFLKTRR